VKHRALIVISAYSSEWPRQYRDEVQLLRTVLPDHVALEHIGSTSVPGMPAKPIIDMMLGADSLVEMQTFISDLERLGYEYMPQHELEMPQRKFLAKPRVRPRHFHLHGVVKGGRFWQDHLRFRDRLRQDPEAATRYAELKRQLAQSFGDDRAGYTSAKSEFISSMISGHGAGEAEPFGQGGI
jgi:GrpB-like predicted nucleotidyltransferase (UPF0157 family)